MNDLEHVTTLFAMAARDLQALRGMARSDGEGDYFADEIFGFHAQQAVEKCLKAWVALRGEQYPWTHDILILLERLEDLGEDVGDLGHLVDLSTFAVQLRYEDQEDTEFDRGDTLANVEAVFNRVRDLLSEAGKNPL